MRKKGVEERLIFVFLGFRKGGGNVVRNNKLSGQNVTSSRKPYLLIVSFSPLIFFEINPFLSAFFR